MRFEFATANRIVFGSGAIREVGGVVQALGRRALVVTGSRSERAEPLFAELRSHRLDYLTFAVPGEPTVALATAGKSMAQEAGCDLIIGYGGGSAMDAAKAIAALATNPGDPLDYLEVIGRGRPLSEPSLPCIAIPTTAGTGSEVTRNAVLASPEHRVKVSLRSPTMLPRVALVDPELTHTMPPEVTASTGLDALAQLIEPFTSVRANPLTDALCREGIARVARSLRRAWADGTDAGAREDMALASLFGGLALANAGLGVVHGFAGPIGGLGDQQGRHRPTPHGMICAALLPYGMAVNVQALRARQPDADALRKYDQIARIVTGDPNAKAEEGIAWVASLTADLRIPGLASYGITAEDVPALVEKAAVASSTKANPLPLSREELAAILRQAL